MLPDRCRLWLTINSMENIPSIDNRSLYADTLNSLYNNVYNLKNIRIQELSNVYDRDYNQLKNLLFNKYLKIIRDSEAGLADLIMNDLNNSYQNQVVDTFNVYTMYGGGPDKDPPVPLTVTQDQIDNRNAHNNEVTKNWDAMRGITQAELDIEGNKFVHLAHQPTNYGTTSHTSSPPVPKSHINISTEARRPPPDSRETKFPR